MTRLTIDQPQGILTIGSLYKSQKVNGRRSPIDLCGTLRFKRGNLDKRIASRIGKAMVDDDEGAE